MQESRNWQWQLNGNTAEGEASDDGWAAIRYKGYTANIVWNPEMRRFSWGIVGESEEHNFDADNITNDIIAIFGAIEHRDAERLAAELARQEAMQTLCRVFDDLSEQV